MKALILAAGFGTRLWPLTEDRTKAAIPFLNRPLISYSVEYLASHGFRDIIVNLHHQPESIRRALGDGSRFGVTLSYSFEEEILGTSGALDPLRESLSGDDFVVINGKIVTNIDLGAAVAEHKERGAIATLVLKENAQREHFSIVEVNERGSITHFAGFPEPAASEAMTAASPGPGLATTAEPAPLMFTGIQVLSPRILEYVPRSRFSHSTVHVYPPAIEAGEPVIAHVSTADWFEMSTLGRYLEANLLFMRKEGRSVIAGQGCEIAEGANVKDCVLWDRVIVEPGARVSKALIADDVRIPAGAVIERAIVVRRGVVSEVERGEVFGENIIIPI
ncbi:MAG: NDP-sugar synthase [Acidobacteriota bacterium]